MLYQNVLLIDDDEDDQEIFLNALEKATHSVNCLAFDSAGEALNKLLRKEIRTDVIFLDLNMPLMNGQQFLSEIKRKELLRDIPVIILSTSSNVNVIELTKKLGAMDFITKPDRFEDLITVLKSIFTSA
ncbi:response regulator [Dyadobacter arcticus]|uniref:CheY-like chemotaxis protein n=1 Tax=Dyadobacter arcticus TaxID=1078754 RepID=A0ABX0UTR9_9BACT|nr:response regulator [Dyadobacter arcticus]NIJ54336.1 CheY-like chemotaxis protein [Dyadobacter arcticus]